MPPKIEFEKIGVINTPYTDSAPYQPVDGECRYVPVPSIVRSCDMSYRQYDVRYLEMQQAREEDREAALCPCSE